MPHQTFFNLPDEKREAFLDAAIEEFAAHDYRSASVSRITKRAGVSKGSFYQYFEDKKDLFLYLLELVSRTKLAFLGELVPADPADDFFTYYQKLIEASAHFQLAYPRLVQIGYRALNSSLPFLDDVKAFSRQSGHAYYEGLLREAVARGDIDPDIDPNLAIFIISTLMVELGDYLIGGGIIDTEGGSEGGEAALEDNFEKASQVVIDLLDILKHGLAPRG